MKGPTQEHEFETVRGLPQELPPGEHVIWQGQPHWRTLARDAMHLPLLTAYFAAMLAWRAGSVWMDTGSLGAAATSIMLLFPLALIALGTLAFLASLASEHSVYTITNKRVVMRIGIVLTVTFNLPFSQIDSASLRPNSNGTGDIALTLAPGERIAYLHLWPHARPWHVRQTQPMLRAVPDCARVSELLVAAISAAATSGPSVVRAGPGPGRVARPGAAASNDALAA